MLLYQILAYTINGEILKSHTKIWKKMKNLNSLVDYILYQIFKTILNISFKKNGEKIDNPWITIYVNKIENRTTFKIKTGYCLKLLTPETIKLFGSKKGKITKDKNDEDMSNLEIT